MMKKFLALILALFISPSAISQEPVPPKKDHIYVEYVTDCNWFIHALRGKIKLHPQHNNAVGFRAWQPYPSYGIFDIKGFVIWRNLGLWTKDCIVFNWSSFKAEYGAPPGIPNVPWGWSYVIHFNELAGTGISNAGTHMRVWGPTGLVRLYHGEAWITHGDKTFFVKVDENDPVNYPPWEITLN